MPTKITRHKTDNTNAEISISDIHKTINDFITKVELKCTDPTRNPVLKHYHFDIQLERVTNVLKMTAGASHTHFRVHLSLNLPSQLDCNNKISLENYLSIVVSGISTDGKDESLLNENNYVLVEGFSDSPNFTGGECCVQGNPPKP